MYADPNCTVPVATGGNVFVLGGQVPTSAPVTLTVPGTYYWRAAYTGDGFNDPASSNCRDEVETVAATTNRTVDHFVCYTANSRPSGGLGFKVPAKVKLINQFSPSGLAPKIGAVDIDCNPARKKVATGVTQITNPNAHLLCWGISAAAAGNTVVVTNQFGSAKLKTGPTSQLCLPSSSSRTCRTPARLLPPGLSHFTCYSVGYAPGGGAFRPPASVLVKDQFSNQPVSVTVGVPKLLCLPTTTIVNGVTHNALNPQVHLAVFRRERDADEEPGLRRERVRPGKGPDRQDETALPAVQQGRRTVRVTGAGTGAILP